MTKRVRAQIFAEILKTIVEESRNATEVRITRVQSKVYVPFDRFKEYLEELRNMGLIERSGLRVTEKGLKFLEEYRFVKDFLEKFGLE